MAARDQKDVARDAWKWLKQAESSYRRTKDGSEEELQAIQAMSLAAMAAMAAEQAKY